MKDLSEKRGRKPELLKSHKQSQQSDNEICHQKNMWGSLDREFKIINYYAGSLSTFFPKLGAYFLEVPTSEMAGEAKPRLKCTERAQPVSSLVRVLASDAICLYFAGYRMGTSLRSSRHQCRFHMVSHSTVLPGNICCSKPEKAAGK
jgi:hypothetical protein